MISESQGPFALNWKPRNIYKSLEFASVVSAYNLSYECLFIPYSGVLRFFTEISRILNEFKWILPTSYTLIPRLTGIPLAQFLVYVHVSWGIPH